MTTVLYSSLGYRKRNVKAKYSILDEDTHNFDETGFTMGVGNRVNFVTTLDRRNDYIEMQQGDCECTTPVAAINAMGWVIAPCLILQAKNHYKSWYSDINPQ